MAELDSTTPRRKTPTAVLLGSALLWALALVFMGLCAADNESITGCAATLMIGCLFAYQAMAVLRGDPHAILALRNILLLVGVAQIAFGAVLGVWFVGMTRDLFGFAMPDVATKVQVVTLACAFAAACWALWLGLRRPQITAWVERDLGQGA